MHAALSLGGLKIVCCNCYCEKRCNRVVEQQFLPTELCSCGLLFVICSLMTCARNGYETVWSLFSTLIKSVVADWAQSTYQLTKNKTKKHTKKRIECKLLIFVLLILLFPSFWYITLYSLPPQAWHEYKLLIWTSLFAHSEESAWHLTLQWLPLHARMECRLSLAHSLSQSKVRDFFFLLFSSCSYLIQLITFVCMRVHVCFSVFKKVTAEQKQGVRNVIMEETKSLGPMT